MPLVFNAGFFEAMAKLPAKEQVACTDFINVFQQNPAQPGIQLHALDAARARNLWSGRVSQDLRAILYKEADTWLLLHVDHHDPAYRWAERRDVGRHPVTGALQVLDIVEKVVEKTVTKARAPGIFDDNDDKYLLSLGVPMNWLPALRHITSENQLFEAIATLPQDVADRLFRLASGELVTPPAPIAASQPLTAAVAATPGFYVVSDASDLAAALAAPFDRWIAFLHPTQQAIVDLTPKGPVKLTGGAGTGKTVVAMHRARALARRGHRVLLTSYVTTLCENLQRNLRKLCQADELAKITVGTVDKQALAIARKVDAKLQPAASDQIRTIITDLAKRQAPTFDAGFVLSEWDAIVDAQGLTTWAEYRSASRTGRGKPLSVTDRKTLWQVFENTLAALTARHEATWSIICRRAEDALASNAVATPFDAVIVDEVQDLRPAALRFLRALAAPHLENLLLAGDAGQRIYAGSFSLGALGIEVRGRSHILKINYRTTEQIRRAADRILSGPADDLDGGKENRNTRSLFRGPEPSIAGFADRKAELADAVRWVKATIAQGLAPDAIAIFARSSKRVDEAMAALSAAGIASLRLDDDKPTPGSVHAGTMHRAKGLEFKAVLVLDVSADTLPSPNLLKAATDPLDRENALARERQLLYVAMTRARDLLRITHTGKPSPFLAPLLELAR